MKAMQAIQHFEPCHEAVKWLNNRSVRKAWQICNRPDWMLWAANQLDIDRKLLVLAACDCAETALKYIPKDEDRPRIAIETARKWCKGQATLKDCKVAAACTYVGAYAAAYAAYAATYAGASAGAAYAGHDAAAYAAHAAADAAYAYAAGAYVGAGAAAREKSNKKMAALVRKRIPVEIIEEAIQCLS